MFTELLISKLSVSLNAPRRFLEFACHYLWSSSFISSVSLSLGDKDGGKVTTVVATPGQGPDRPQEVSYTDTKVIGNGSFGVVYQAKLCDSGEMVAIKKVLQDKRFKVKMKTRLPQLTQLSDSSTGKDA